MINVVTVEETAACILFGQPVRGGQQAAWFSQSEVEAARKAKNAKTLATITPVPPELEEVVKGLARGRVEGGQVILTKAAPDAYAKLLAASAAQRKNGAVPAAPAQAPKTAADAPAEGTAKAGLPAVVSPAPAPVDGWSHLKEGDLVLAFYGPEDGWWAARILKIENDSCTLAWTDENEPMVRRTRAQLALFHPRRI